MHTWQTIILTATFLCSCAPADKGSEASADASTCAPLAAIEDMADIATSPRQNVEAEALVLQCSQGLMADTPLYQRVAQDLAAIRALDARMVALSDHWTRALQAPVQVTVHAADAATAQALAQGTAPAFQCLNAALGATVTGASENRVTLNLPGTYVLETLNAAYARVPGVTGVYGPGFIGDGHRVLVDPRSNPRRYVFDQAGGDCPAGCTEHHYFNWEVADGAVPLLVAESFHPQDGSNPGFPDWVQAAYRFCK